jgi:signal transduction histidine kinase
MGATTRLETVVKDITLLNDLVNESLESRSFEPVLMREVVDSAFRNLRRSWQHKNDVDRIVTKIPAHLPPAFGDKQRLVIAMQLLMDNALKFSKAPVEVIMETLPGKIRVTVRDQGIGIPKDKIDKVFDTFYQVDNSTTKRYGGMGIGLAIVRFILDRHQAQITVETEEGKGSSFIFELVTVEVRAS